MPSQGRSPQPGRRLTAYRLSKSQTQSPISARLVSLLYRLPVDDVPERGDVVRAPVLILQVVGVFPHVQAQDRRAGQAGDIRRPSAGCLDSRSSRPPVCRSVTHQPSPAAAEAIGCGVAEGLFEGRESAQFGCRSPRPACRPGVPPALRPHDRPEQRVVRVTAAVIADDRPFVVGTAAKSAIRFSTALISRSVPLMASFTLVMYAWWCLVWWISIVRASMCGSRAS